MPDRRTTLIALATGVAAGTLATVPLWNLGSGKQDPEQATDLRDQKNVDTLHQNYRFEKATSPDRTAVRSRTGVLAAELTHGSRTVVVTAAQRTFTEPAATRAKVVTTSWVYPAPEPFTTSKLNDEQYAAWLLARIGGGLDDVLGSACEYVTGRPDLARAGVKFAGDAGFGLIHNDDTRDGADFYDYLGIPWRWPDGTMSRPSAMWARRVDCSGFLRLVYGYRMGVPLYPRNEDVDGLPRTAYAIAERATSTTIADAQHPDEPPRDLSRVAPGDLVFFAAHSDMPTLITHSGIVLGKDTDGGTRFVSSRETVDGPTFGDVGGAGTLESGFFSTRLRKVIRL